MSPPPRTLDELWDALNQPSKQLEQGDKALLQEALTHTSSGLNPHHEQLEFLGDAVLRLRLRLASACLVCCPVRHLAETASFSGRKKAPMELL